MSHNFDTTRDRGLKLLDRLPPRPFTVEGFVAARRTSGLNAFEHFDVIAQILHYLIKNELIRGLNEIPRQPSQWVRTRS